MDRLFRIIVLEDLQSDFELIEHELQEAEINCEICWTKNKSDFQEAFESFNPNVIISDYKIPGYTGLDALEFVLEREPFIPFILVTGTMGEEKAVATIKAGVTEFLLKENLSRLPEAIVKSIKLADARRAEKSAMDKLKQSEFQFRSLIEHSHDFILLFDDDLNISYSSPAFQRALGYVSTEISGKSMADFIHVGDYERLTTKIKELKSGDATLIQLRNRWRSKKKSYRWMESVISDQRNLKGIEGFVSNVRDIHDQYQAEMHLQNKHLLINSVMNNLSEGVLATNKDGKIILSNPAAESILNTEKKEGLSKVLKSFDAYYQSDGKTQYKKSELPMKKAIKGLEVRNEEMLIKNQGNHEGVLVNLNARPLVNEDKKIYGSVLSFSDISEKKHYQDELEKTLEQLEKIVEKRTEQLSKTNMKLEEANKHITYSINYAKRIQQALTLSTTELRRRFAESFMIYLPRDIVSGDFVWMFDGPGNHLAVADCTGHGVPGAMLSMIGNELLDRIIADRRIHRPEIVLEEMDKSITELMQKNNSDYTINDGMDLSLCSFDFERRRLYFSGAHNPGIIIQNGEVNILPCDRQSIGGFSGYHQKEFNRTIVSYEKGDRLYLFTDGFQDQFGGEKSKKFTKRRLIEMLSELKDLPMSEQKNEISSAFNRWKGKEMQVDDVTMVGVELP